MGVVVRVGQSMGPALPGLRQVQGLAILHRFFVTHHGFEQELPALVGKQVRGGY